MKELQKKVKEDTKLIEILKNEINKKEKELGLLYRETRDKVAEETLKKLGMHPEIKKYIKEKEKFEKIRKEIEKLIDDGFKTFSIRITYYSDGRININNEDLETWAKDKELKDEIKYKLKTAYRNYKNLGEKIKEKKVNLFHYY